MLKRHVRSVKAFMILKDQVCTWADGEAGQVLIICAKSARLTLNWVLPQAIWLTRVNAQNNYPSYGPDLISLCVYREIKVWLSLRETTSLAYDLLLSEKLQPMKITERIKQFALTHKCVLTRHRWLPAYRMRLRCIQMWAGYVFLAGMIQ